VRERLKSARYALADLAYLIGRAVGRVPRAVGRGFGDFWGRLTVVERRRLLAAVGAVVVILLVLALAVPRFPCEFPGGDACAPEDSAAELVPADALAYVHADLDPDSDQMETAGELADATPVLSDQLISRALALLPGLAGTRAQFDSEIRPWFGDELAGAILGGPRGPERVVLIEAQDSEGAARFAARLSGGVATEQVEGFLVLGTAAGVRAVSDAANGGGEPLSADATATEALDRLPAERFAEAWISPEGAQQLIAASRGQLATLTPLISPGATEGVAASLGADEDGYELAIRSLLNAERASASPGFFAAFPSFEPELPERLPADALAYLGFDDPGRTIRALLTQASAQAPGIAGGFEALVRRLRKEGGVDVEGELLGALEGEAALSILPRGEGEEQSGLPFLELVADDVDEEAARRALAALQAPLAAAASRDVQAPIFEQQDVEGVEAHSLRLSPTIDLTYAVFDGLAAIATDRQGIAALASDDGGLDEADRFKAATDELPDEVSLLAYFDLHGLVSIGERMGLAEDPLYATFAGDFRSLEALGLAVSSSEDELATDVRLEIAG
jgi:hypothetical protein